MMVARRLCICSDGSGFTASVWPDHGRSRYRRVIRGQAIVAEREFVCGPFSEVAARLIEVRSTRHSGLDLHLEFFAF
jgi:hypothetical protein